MTDNDPKRCWCGESEQHLVHSPNENRWHLFDPQPPAEPTLDLAKFKKPQPAPSSGLTAEQRKLLDESVAPGWHPQHTATRQPDLYLASVIAALAEIDAQANLIDALDRQVDGLESQRDALRSHMDEYHSDCYSKVQGDALRAENERLRAAVLDKDAAIRLLTATDDAGRAQVEALRALVAEAAQAVHENCHPVQHMELCIRLAKAAKGEKAT